MLTGFIAQAATTPRPYDIQPKDLYTVDQLMEGYDDVHYQTSLDARIGAFFEKAGDGFPEDPEEALAERLHDHYVLAALDRYVKKNTPRIVGIMGGYDVPRTDPHFIAAARVAYQLTQKGYTIVSGGGLGIMEAANLGAYMSAYSEAELDAVTTRLQAAADFKTDLAAYTNVAREIRTKYPNGATSLAVPTWVYRNEPLSQFTTWIAKLFANSVREDGLVSLGNHGIVYFRGGAGTMQELWQDAAQNAYAALHKWPNTPMVLYDSDIWDRRMSEVPPAPSQGVAKPPLIYDGSVYRLLRSLAIARGSFQDQLKVADNVTDAVQFLMDRADKMPTAPTTSVHALLQRRVRPAVI